MGDSVGNTVESLSMPLSVGTHLSLSVSYCQAQLQLQLQLKLELSLVLVPLNPATHPPADRESIFYLS